MSKEQLALEITKFYLKDYDVNQEHKHLEEYVKLFNGTFNEVCNLLDKDEN